MSEPAGEHERTMAFAEIAFGQIKALHQPATPRNYEVWYTYATGYNPSLNQMVNETLAKNGTLTDADLELVYTTYISATRFSDKIDSVGTRVMDEINQLQENLEVVRTESLTDPLTSLSNRKHFDESLAQAIADSAERSEPLSLVMTDIDHFKNFNDTWGHLTGDQVLRLVAMSLKQNVKGQDIAARYGGEEFAVILPNTVLRSALTVADHIRRAVMSKELMKRSTGQNLGRVTISLGCATARKGDTVQSLIARADACLYAAKRSGRNRVICETDPEFAATAESKVA
jgi:diguanylate cyclase